MQSPMFDQHSNTFGWHPIQPGSREDTMRHKMPAFLDPDHARSQWVTNSGRDVSFCQRWTREWLNHIVDGMNVRLKCECFQMCASQSCSSVCSMIETHSLAKSQHGIAMQPVTPSDTVALLWSVVCQNSAIMWSQSTIMHLQLYVLTWHGYVDREAGIEWKYQSLWSSGRSTWFNKVLHHMTFNGALTIQVIFSFRNALPAGPI